MYDFKLLDNEKIKIIKDNSKIYEKNNYENYTIIITNLRLLVLNYPSNINNSMEDLRSSQRLFYIKKKEVIFEIDLNKILKFEISKNILKLFISKENYLIIKDNSLLNFLKEEKII